MKALGFIHLVIELLPPNVPKTVIVIIIPIYGQTVEVEHYMFVHCIFPKLKWKTKTTPELTNNCSMSDHLLSVTWKKKNSNRIYLFSTLYRHKGATTLTDKTFRRAKWTFTTLHPWPLEKYTMKKTHTHTHIYENNVVDTKVKSKKQNSKKRRKNGVAAAAAAATTRQLGENVYAHGQQARIVRSIYAFRCIST